MKCVCRVKCQIRLADGPTLIVRPGEVREFEKCPDNFEELNQVSPATINFMKIGAEELAALDWSFDEAAEVIEANCGVKLKRAKKSDVIEQIVDARYRKVG